MGGAPRVRLPRKHVAERGVSVEAEPLALGELHGLARDALWEERREDLAGVRGALGGASTAAARDHLRALERKGALRREHGARNYRLANVPTSEEMTTVPIIQRFARGVDVLAEVNHEGEVSVPSSWLTRGRFFAFTMGVDIRSLAILEGDVLLVRPARKAAPGALAVLTTGTKNVVHRVTERDEELSGRVVGEVTTVVSVMTLRPEGLLPRSSWRVLAVKTSTCMATVPVVAEPSVARKSHELSATHPPSGASRRGASRRLSRTRA